MHVLPDAVYADHCREQCLVGLRAVPKDFSLGSDLADLLLAHAPLRTVEFHFTKVDTIIGSIDHEINL